MHRLTHSYEALLSTHFNIILPTALWRPVRNNTTHLYSFCPRLTLSWQALIIFRTFIIETKLDFVSFNDKHLQRRPNNKLLHWSGLMSESQQGPEICNVISRKRFYLIYRIYSINRPGRLLKMFGPWECPLIRGWALIKFSPFSASEVCLFCNKTINANSKTRRSNKARFL